MNSVLSRLAKFYVGSDGRHELAVSPFSTRSWRHRLSHQGVDWAGSYGSKTYCCQHSYRLLFEREF